VQAIDGPIVISIDAQVANKCEQTMKCSSHTDDSESMVRSKPSTAVLLTTSGSSHPGTQRTNNQTARVLENEHLIERNAAYYSYYDIPSVIKWSVAYVNVSPAREIPY